MRFRFNLLPVLCLLLFSIIFNGCDDTVPKDTDIPTAGVSYKTHIAPVFAVKCNNSSCHADGVSGRPVLTSYYNVTKDPSLVVKGDPETSRLVWSIEWRSGALQMPPQGSVGLTTKEINGIKTWIREGAQNN